MLIKMEIENFKSFKNKTVLDFINNNNYELLQNRNVTNKILKGSIFVGGNATGKTNIISAIKILLDLLFSDTKINLSNYKCMFSEEDIIKLNYTFNVENNKIEYKIEYDVIQEILVEKLTLNKSIILGRVGESGRVEILQQKNFSNLEKDSLLLRSSYNNKLFNDNLILKKWFDYLKNSIYLDTASSKSINNKSKSILSDYLNENGVSEINEFFTNHNFNWEIQYINNDKMQNQDIEKYIYLKRDGINKLLPLSMESLGNKNLLTILPSFFNVIKNGGMLIIDEFSNSFHNELEELLVKVFMKNSKKSQLFLVSHSTNLLSNTIFRPDQEYSIDFDGEEGSIVNRFSDSKPRETQSIEKMYNSGCFGGSPEYLL